MPENGSARKPGRSLLPQRVCRAQRLVAAWLNLDGWHESAKLEIVGNRPTEGRFRQIHRCRVALLLFSVTPIGEPARSRWNTGEGRVHNRFDLQASWFSHEAGQSLRTGLEPSTGF